MAKPITNALKQNNTVNIYEEYFTSDETDYGGEVPKAKGLAIFRDPNNIKVILAGVCGVCGWV
jgi:dynein intermediate chain 2, axonemal